MKINALRKKIGAAGKAQNLKQVSKGLKVLGRTDEGGEGVWNEYGGKVKGLFGNYGRIEQKTANGDRHRPKRTPSRSIIQHLTLPGVPSL